MRAASATPHWRRSSDSLLPSDSSLHQVPQTTLTSLADSEPTAWG
jgi:hypothetical protein